MKLINDVTHVIKLNQNDNVGVVTRPLPKGFPIDDDGRLSRSNVPAGHKICIHPIPTGQPVIKYGQIIGLSNCAIDIGEHVHTHNVTMIDLFVSLDGFRPAAITPVFEKKRTFKGYKRKDGRVGTRNYIGILTTVNCSATVAKVAAETLDSSTDIKSLGYDGVVAITHGSGCAINTDTEGYQFLERVISGYAEHPNFSFVLIIGLGCETNQVKGLVERMGLEDDSRLYYFNIQDSGGTRSSIKKATEKIMQMAKLNSPTGREDVSLEHLSVALQCGGSDGYSGITANPALGYASDMIVQHGGSVILGETPEIYGAEHLLIKRAVNRDVAEKLLERIDWWKNYTSINGAEMNNNPTPGNKAGGLTTILEKSLGAVAKAGTSSLNDVLEYAERLNNPGFNFMDSPGYDPVSVTGQIAAGANIVCFTTGRGSVSGYKPSPCIKLATNTSMYEKMKEDMDINCGLIVDGDASLEEIGNQIFEMIIAVASGEMSASETLGYGDNEFVPWMVGAIT